MSNQIVNNENRINKNNTIQNKETSINKKTEVNKLLQRLPMVKVVLFWRKYFEK